jgi:hypothetical protein
MEEKGEDPRFPAGFLRLLMCLIGPGVVSVPWVVWIGVVPIPWIVRVWRNRRVLQHGYLDGFHGSHFTSFTSKHAIPDRGDYTFSTVPTTSGRSGTFKFIEMLCMFVKGVNASNIPPL